MDARLLMDSPRDRMVEAAISGMRASGLAGAGINQVVTASGAPKGSLYHYFPGGKLQLACEALERFGAERRAALEKALAGDSPPDQKIRRLFAGMAKGLAREDFQLGCAVAGVALDLEPGSAELAPVCASQLETWAQAIADALEPAPPARRLLLGRFAVSAMEGATVQARASRSTEPLLAAGDLLASLVRQELSLV